MGKCRICGEKSPLISGKLGVCLDCIRRKSEKALEVTAKVHADARKTFGLPPSPPRTRGGVRCEVCANCCVIGEDETGYCGLVANENGRLVRYAGFPDKGLLEYYYDPLPTNCVAWWFCAGCTGRGYPRYAYLPKAEIGYENLAVFYGACSYDCLFCQNWHFRSLAQKRQPTISAEELAAKAHEKVSCICYFGGDPSPQIIHALKTSQIALQKAQEEKRILRICWETNGYMNPKLALKAAELSLYSGGIVKFDLKTWSNSLNVALCGVSNKPTLENFRRIGEKYYKARLEPPLLTASTLLVPGYVDAEEVENIARFIAEINPTIPYTLLAFYPQYVMNDLPTTSRKTAEECYRRARKHLENVRIGNVHLLS
ncbi:radical SAM protein [Candidatus Bathyarchaeota archaeon]|nr:MAG: radical SAM protein [Candidatus Bathyarchaeota archaeon]